MVIIGIKIKKMVIYRMKNDENGNKTNNKRRKLN